MILIVDVHIIKFYIPGKIPFFYQNTNAQQEQSFIGNEDRNLEKNIIPTRKWTPLNIPCNQKRNIACPHFTLILE